MYATVMYVAAAVSVSAFAYAALDAARDWLRARRDAAARSDMLETRLRSLRASWNHA